MWIFDLDNTLHDADFQVFPFLSRSMTRYIETHLGLDEAAASQLRTRYWRRYGATLLGLVRHHGTDPHHFLRETHAFPDLRRAIRRHEGLRRAMRSLPGRKAVFSNAPLHYVEAVLRELRMHHLFCAVASIEHTRFRPKPHIDGFRRLLARLRTRARRCIMVEDTAENLRTAKRMGMATLWVGQGPHRPRHVDTSVRGIPGLIHALRGLHGRGRALPPKR